MGDLPKVPTGRYGYFFSAITPTSISNLVAQLEYEHETYPLARIHLAVHSGGGEVESGLALYDYLTQVPYQLSLYCYGSVESIAAVAFLAANDRVISPNGSFMFHRVIQNLRDATLERMIEAVESIKRSQNRIDAILKDRLSFDDVAWDKLKTMDLRVEADCAIHYGIVNRIGRMEPPKGVTSFVVTK